MYNDRMQDLIRTLLAEIGEDPSREGLIKTPERVERSLKFLTSGYDSDVDTLLNGALFTVDYTEMVIVKDVDSIPSANTICCRSSASVTSRTCPVTR